MNKVLLYKKRLLVEAELLERKFLSSKGIVAKLEYVRGQPGRWKRANPITHVVFIIVTSKPLDILLTRRYEMSVLTGDEAEAALAGHMRVGGASTVVYPEKELGRKLADELAANEEYCKRSFGKRVRKREHRIGGGIRPGQRRGKTIEVFGTCSYCLTGVPRRWRFNTNNWKSRPVFLCEGCIELARGRKSRAGSHDAMYKAVYRRRSRG